jgi:hypothetical protein
LEAYRERERRGAPRFAFFTGATLRPASDPETLISVFSREISTIGIGLLHATPVGNGERFEVEIRVEDVCVRKPVTVVWCRPVAQGWHLSGCRFG